MSGTGDGEYTPRHIAVIMDGNGRWATARGLPRVEGHREGAEAAYRAIQGCIDRGVRYLTLFAFSTENWSRPRGEIQDLMGLFCSRLLSLEERLPNGARIRFMGRLDALGPQLRGLIEQAENREAGAERLLVSVAINYGGRAEIVDATRRLAVRVAGEGLDPESISEEDFADALLFRGIPDPDLVLRTAGEQRLSNFLLWQSAYAELMFIDCFWPDFGRETLDGVLMEFASRERRFGAVVRP